MVKVSSAFALACELGAARGWKNIVSLPGCQEAEIDEHWWMAINPHSEPAKCSTGGMVPPVSIYFQFNGWPAGAINSGGGVIAAGRMANEDTLIAALEAAIKKTGAPRWGEE